MTRSSSASAGNKAGSTTAAINTSVLSTVRRHPISPFLWILEKPCYFCILWNKVLSYHNQVYYFAFSLDLSQESLSAILRRSATTTQCIPGFKGVVIQLSHSIFSLDLSQDSLSAYLRCVAKPKPRSTPTVPCAFWDKKALSWYNHTIVLFHHFSVFVSGQFMSKLKGKDDRKRVAKQKSLKHYQCPELKNVLELTDISSKWKKVGNLGTWMWMKFGCSICSM